MPPSSVTTAWSSSPTVAAMDRVTGATLSDVQRSGAVQLWPHLHATDAMFVQLLTTR